MNGIKRYEIIGTLLLMLFVQLSAFASVRLTAGGVEYVTISDEEASACLTVKAIGDVIISESITIKNKSYKVVRLTKAYFKKNQYLTSLNIPNSVKQIDEGAVRGCPNLQILTIPDQACSIDPSAFEGCKSITQIWNQNRSVANVDYILAVIDKECPYIVNPRPMPTPTPVSTPLYTESNNSPVLPISSVEDEDVDVDIPTSNISNNNTFVLIIGNEEYKKINAGVPFAANDAKMIKEYCVKVLGIPSIQVDMYINATFGDFIDGIDKLKNRLTAFKGKGKAIVYYAGHGIPDVKNNTAFLLPVDGRDARTAYSLDKMYAELNSVEADQVMVFLDACFTGANREGEMLSKDRAVAVEVEEPVPHGNLLVFTAATGKQTANCYKDKNHGIFTYYLLQHLKRTKGKTTCGSLAEYVQEKVEQRSVIINDGKAQTPTVIPSTSIMEDWKSRKFY